MKIENNIVHGPPLTDVPDTSLGQYLLDHLRKNSDMELQVDVETGRRLTCRDVLERSAMLGTFLRDRGINVEDRISVAAENHPNYIILTCGTLFAGGTIAPLNPAYTEREYRHMLEILQPRLIFVSRRTERLLAGIASSVSWTMVLVQVDDEALDRNVVTLKQIFEDYENVVDPREFVSTPIDDSRKRAAAILCSSGTTGFPKGVTLSHRNFLVFLRTFRHPTVLEIVPGERIILFLPMFHGYAIGLLYLSMCAGATIYLMRSFDLVNFMKAIEKYRITYLPLVPPIMVALLKHPSAKNYDFSSVTKAICGAAPFPTDVADGLKKLLNVREIRNGYGMTELTIISNVSDGTGDYRTVGPVVPGFRFKVADPLTGKTLPAGEIGELCYAGEQVMLGYFRDPKNTADTVDGDGWLHTGDLGYFDQRGLVYVTGRIKELIKYKGFQVSPSEVEAVLVSHPGVKEAAVIGKPDELSGELPMAFVVKQPAVDVSAEEIVKLSKENLSPQKWLRGGVQFVESIPKTPSGKILRRELLNMISKL